LSLDQQDATIAAIIAKTNLLPEDIATQLDTNIPAIQALLATIRTELISATA
jgi:hypothetical protein